MVYHKAQATLCLLVLLGEQVRHDAIVKQGTNRDKIVYSQLSNIKEKRGDAEKLQAPTADEEALTAERTRQAFEKVRWCTYWLPSGVQGSVLYLCTRCTAVLCCVGVASGNAACVRVKCICDTLLLLLYGLSREYAILRYVYDSLHLSVVCLPHGC